MQGKRVLLRLVPVLQIKRLNRDFLSRLQLCLYGLIRTFIGTASDLYSQCLRSEIILIIRISITGKQFCFIRECYSNRVLNKLDIIYFFNVIELQFCGRRHVIVVAVGTTHAPSDLLPGNVCDFARDIIWRALIGLSACLNRNGSRCQIITAVVRIIIWIKIILFSIPVFINCLLRNCYVCNQTLACFPDTVQFQFILIFEVFADIPTDFVINSSIIRSLLCGSPAQENIARMDEFLIDDDILISRERYCLIAAL